MNSQDSWGKAAEANHIQQTSVNKSKESDDEEE